MDRGVLKREAGPNVFTTAAAIGHRKEQLDFAAASGNPVRAVVVHPGEEQFCGSIWETKPGFCFLSVMSGAGSICWGCRLIGPRPPGATPTQSTGDQPMRTSLPANLRPGPGLVLKSRLRSLTGGRGDRTIVDAEGDSHGAPADPKCDSKPQAKASLDGALLSSPAIPRPRAGHIIKGNFSRSW